MMRDDKDKSERTAADWFVELDAGSIDPNAETALAAWLASDPAHEAALERCEAAVLLARRLGRDPAVAWAFDEAARLAAGPPPRESPRRRVAWHRRPALAWGVAGLSLAVAALAVVVRDSPTAVPVDRDAAAALPAEIVIDLATAQAVVVLPGRIVVDARSVAVLPFSTESTDGAQGDAATPAIAAELYAEVVEQLAAVPGVYVVGPPSVMPYANGDIAPAEVAAQLGVRGIVEAVVASEDGRIRVSLRLIDTAGEGLLLQGAFERPVGEMTAMQADIVTNIAVALGGALTSAEWAATDQQ